MDPFGYSSTELGFNQFTPFSPVSTYSSHTIHNGGHSPEAPFATEHAKPSPPSNSLIISFQNSDLSPDFSQQYSDGELTKMKRCGSGTISRTALHAQEHVIAERKRREKLSQRFVALSTIIPGLTKNKGFDYKGLYESLDNLGTKNVLDKASVLGDTIKYMKQLEERVKFLEEEAATRTVESAIFVKKSSLQHGNSIVSFSSEEKLHEPIINQQLPEVEARVSGKNVLIKVQCEKREGCIKELMKHMEDMNLTTLNVSILAFGISLLDATIVAQLDYENGPTIEEIVKNLHCALMTFIGSSSRQSAC